VGNEGLMGHLIVLALEPAAPLVAWGPSRVTLVLRPVTENTRCAERCVVLTSEAENFWTSSSPVPDL
jgi:hypothetical protein